MKTIEIDGKIFDVPDYCYYVAVDYDGEVCAYEKAPGPGECLWIVNNFDISPSETIGDLGRVVPDWKDRLYIFPQKNTA